MQRNVPVWPHQISPLQKVDSPLYRKSGLEVFIKRDDLLKPCGGNKWRKLKYYHKHIRETGIRSFVTFGGPFSNHIYASAEFCRYFGLKGKACIRGDIQDRNNPVLSFARECGLELISLTRKQYAERYTDEFREHMEDVMGAETVFIPEGGSSDLGHMGSAEIVSEVIDQLGYRPQYWITASGTGTSAVGIASALQFEEKVIGVSALREKIARAAFELSLRRLTSDQASRLEWNFDYHFGGLARWNEELLGSMASFGKDHGIILDPLYTGKVVFALEALVAGGYFSHGSTIVLVHTGGLPGKLAFEYRNGITLN